MNIRRFTARSSRDALVMVREAFGDDAVVLSTKPSADGIEVLAMAPEGLQPIDRTPNRTPALRAEAPAAPPRQDALHVDAGTAGATVAAPLLREPPLLSVTIAPEIDLPIATFAEAPPGAVPAVRPVHPTADQMMAELREMKGLIEARFGALAYLEKLNRQPGQLRLVRKLLDCGFSPALIKKIGDSLPMDVGDEAAWVAGVLERNLFTAEAESPLEDQGGVYALVGATGVGKTTTTAKLAAAFPARYGAALLGLITLDTDRIGAHEQLRAYGRILGAPAHTAHDRASLEDLLELLTAKKMVLIDTAGMAQRDIRTKELLEMVSHRSIRKLLVINAASQGETNLEVMVAYHAQQCAGIVLSKLDEAVKLGPALDAVIRMKLKIVGIANGQRVPDDWHRLGASALVQRALRVTGSSAYRVDAADLGLVFTAPASAEPHPLHA